MKPTIRHFPLRQPSQIGRIEILYFVLELKTCSDMSEFVNPISLNTMYMEPTVMMNLEARWWWIWESSLNSHQRLCWMTVDADDANKCDECCTAIGIRWYQGKRRTYFLIPFCQANRISRSLSNISILDICSTYNVMSNERACIQTESRVTSWRRHDSASSTPANLTR